MRDGRAGGSVVGIVKCAVSIDGNVLSIEISASRPKAEKWFEGLFSLMGDVVLG